MNKEIQKIKQAYADGQRSCLTTLESMWKAGESSSKLLSTFTQTEIAQRAKVPQPFISYSIKFYQRFPKFNVNNPPSMLKGKTIREVWHKVLPKTSGKRQPKEEKRESDDILQLGSLSSGSLASQMQVGDWNRLLNQAETESLTITQLIAKLLTASISESNVVTSADVRV